MVTINVAIVIVLAWFWAVLTQESQLLAAVLVSGNVLGSVELYRFFVESHEKKLNKPDLYPTLTTAHRMVYHRTKWQADANTLIFSVGNRGRDAARLCHADLTIQGITEILEPLPWRLLDIAGGHGASWVQSNTANILRGFKADLWVCFSFSEATEAYIETSTPESQDSIGHGPYLLRFGQDYEATLRVFGEEVDLKVWKFKFRVIAWDKFEYAQPEEIFKEQT